MKKKMFAAVLGIGIILMLSSCVIGFLDWLFDTQNTSSDQASSVTNSRQNYGRLPNTSWISTGGDLFGGVYYYTLDFGNGNYRFAGEYNLYGLPISASETGTYTVSGDTVIFTSDEEKTVIANSSESSGDSKQIRGSIIGNSLIVGGYTYR